MTSIRSSACDAQCTGDASPDRRKGSDRDQDAGASSSSASVLIGLKGYLVDRGQTARCGPSCPRSGDNSCARSPTRRSFVSGGYAPRVGYQRSGRRPHGLPPFISDGRDHLRVGPARSTMWRLTMPRTNVINICDTRVSVYYEGCDPKPSGAYSHYRSGRHAAECSALRAGAAWRSSSPVKQHDDPAHERTASVAGADDSGARGNAIGIVTDGKVQMLCGMHAHRACLQV